MLVTQITHLGGLHIVEEFSVLRDEILRSPRQGVCIAKDSIVRRANNLETNAVIVTFNSN